MQCQSEISVGPASSLFYSVDLKNLRDNGYFEVRQNNQDCNTIGHNKKRISRSISPFIYKPLPPYKKMNAPTRKICRSTQTEYQNEVKFSAEAEDVDGEILQNRRKFMRDFATSPIYTNEVSRKNSHFDELEKLTGHIIIHKFFTRGEVDLKQFIRKLSAKEATETPDPEQEEAPNLENFKEPTTEVEVPEPSESEVEEICEKTTLTLLLNSETRPKLQETEKCREYDAIQCECFVEIIEEICVQTIIKPIGQEPPGKNEINQEISQEFDKNVEIEVEDCVQFPILVPPPLSPIIEAFGHGKSPLIRSLSLDSGFQTSCTEPNSQNSIRNDKMIAVVSSGRKSQSLIEILPILEPSSVDCYGVEFILPIQVDVACGSSTTCKKSQNFKILSDEENRLISQGEELGIGIIEEYLNSSDISEHFEALSEVSSIINDIEDTIIENEPSTSTRPKFTKSSVSNGSSSRRKLVHNKSISVQTNKSFKSSNSSLSTTCDGSSNSERTSRGDNSPVNIDLQIISKKIQQQDSACSSNRGYLPTSSSNLNILNLDLSLDQGEKINLNLKVTRDGKNYNKGKSTTTTGSKGLLNTTSNKDHKMLKNVEDKVKRSLDRLSKTTRGGGITKK